MGKGVGTNLIGLHYKPACAQARHAQYLDGTETVRQIGHSKCSHSRINVTTNTTEDTMAERKYIKRNYS